MGLTSIPSRTIGSLGPVKSDPRGRSPNVRGLHPDEWNEACDRTIELAETIGLEDGTTEGSLVETLRRVRGAGSVRRWSFFDDFKTFDTSGARWDATEATFGVVQTPGAVGVSIDDGFGWLNFNVASSAGSKCSIDHANAIIRPSSNPTMRAWIKLPVLANARIAVGFRDGSSEATAAKLMTNSSGRWAMFARSAAGGASSGLNPFPAVEGVYEVRMELVGGASFRADVRANGQESWTTIGTLTTAAAIPQDTDALRPFVEAETLGGNDDLYVDWIHVEGDV